MPEKIIAILTGTKEIYQPLYRYLQKTLKNKIILLTEKDVSTLKLKLEDLSCSAEVWAFPSNELALNLVIQAAANNKRVHLPATAKVTDKAILYALFENYMPQAFKKIPSAIIDSQHLHKEFKFSFPLVVKPCTKDREDSFTKKFPAKAFLATSQKELRNLIEQIPLTQFLAQEFCSGSPVSWCGSITNNKLCGYALKTLIKSPEVAYGGTSTLVELENPDTALEKAVLELHQFLHLEGIFEIEFIAANDNLFFFYEINPRPWLQAALVLQETPEPFAEYLKSQGFIVREHHKPPIAKRKLWGSTKRYLQLSKKISWPTFFKVLRHDIYFSNYFTLSEKIIYGLSLIKIYCKKVFTQ